MLLPMILPILSLVLAVHAADFPIAKPESVGMSAERLAHIGTWLRGVVEHKQAAGFVTLVARRGKVVHHEAFGTMGLNDPRPMPRNALFDLASMTKPITVAAALTLLEEGKITLNDNIGDYLPEFRNPRLAIGRGEGSVATRGPITVRHLFNHTSGVTDAATRADTFKHPTLEAYMQELARKPIAHEPGTAYLYGNSHNVLGYLVQKVSGQPLDRYVADRILTPLGMRDTWYWPPHDTDSRRAVLVVRGKDDPQSLSRIPPEAAKARTFIGGASGLYSTAADYWRFAQMLLNGGQLDGKRVLGPRTIAWIAENHIGDLAFSTPGHRFGLGMAVTTDRGKSNMPYSNGTYYWSGSQGTLFWIDPKEELIGVLMVQLTPSPLKLRERFSQIVYSAILE
ncbi:MAG: beta-lactamase family protein [Bryobacterales bacterium]|nr:beta-lactamase family protein [Bryobacterales bacterium]